MTNPKNAMVMNKHTAIYFNHQAYDKEFSVEASESVCCNCAMWAQHYVYERGANIIKPCKYGHCKRHGGQKGVKLVTQKCESYVSESNIGAEKISGAV